MASCDVHSCSSLLGREVGITMFLHLSGPLLRDSHLTIRWFTAYGNTQQKVNAWSHCLQPAAPQLQWLETLPHLGTPPHSFCDPRDPETMLSYMRFHSALPSEWLLAKLLKVLILYSAAYNSFHYLDNGGSLPLKFIF